VDSRLYRTLCALVYSTRCFLPAHTPHRHPRTSTRCTAACRRDHANTAFNAPYRVLLTRQRDGDVLSLRLCAKRGPHSARLGTYLFVPPALLFSTIPSPTTTPPHAPHKHGAAGNAGLTPRHLRCRVHTLSLAVLLPPPTPPPKRHCLPSPVPYELCAFLVCVQWLHSSRRTSRVPRFLSGVADALCRRWFRYPKGLHVPRIHSFVSSSHHRTTLRAFRRSLPLPVAATCLCKQPPLFYRHAKLPP